MIYDKLINILRAAQTATTETELDNVEKNVNDYKNSYPNYYKAVIDRVKEEKQNIKTQTK